MSSYLVLKKLWKIIFNYIFLFSLTTNVFFLIKGSFSQEKFEGLIVSINSEVITTYDLSQRIKLALKSLKLEDNITNRDTVRERVLELLILEKVKKIEAEKSEIEVTDDELESFTSTIYNFPKEEFESFKNFFEEEGFDIDILLEQMASELLWKKFLQRNIASKITISEKEIEDSFNERTSSSGKYEFSFNEIQFSNKIPGNWNDSEKRMKEFLALLDKGISFQSLSNKFSEIYKMDNNQDEWILEDNIEKETKEKIVEMKTGQIINFKNSEGYKIIKLNKKRFVGSNKFKYSFLKISSFDIESLKNYLRKNIDCIEKKEDLSEQIETIKFDNILLDEMSDLFKNNLEKLSEDEISPIIKNNQEFMALKLCKRVADTEKAITKQQIEKQIYAKKFNQMANTLISNLRQNTNVKFFNK